MDEWVTRWVCRLRTHVYLAFLKQGFYILKLTGLSTGFQRARRRVSIGFHTTNEWAVAAEFPEINFMAQTTLQPHPTVDSGCLSGEGIYRDPDLVPCTQGIMFSEHLCFPLQTVVVLQILLHFLIAKKKKTKKVNTNSSHNPFFIKYVLELAGYYVTKSLLIICWRFSYQF